MGALLVGRASDAQGQETQLEAPPVAELGGVTGGAFLSPMAVGRWGTAPPSCSPGCKAPQLGGGLGGALPCRGEPDHLPGMGASKQPALQDRGLLNWAN